MSATPAAPAALEAALAAFSEEWRHEYVIGDLATYLECPQVLTLAGLLRAAGLADVAEEWLVTHVEFTAGCGCLDRHFVTRPDAK